jgi:NADPH2:quinone reductase
MKAIRIEAFGGPDSLRLADLAEPVPGPGEVTIDVAFAGVGFVDTLFRRGAFPLPLPLTLGIEVSGHMRDVGPDVAGLAPGDPVAALLNDFVSLPGAGGYAEIALARAALTIPLTRGASLAQAAAVLVNGTTAWMAIKDLARVGRGEDVLVLGATGGLGRLLGLLARKAGAGRVIGVIGSETKREAASRLGYSEILLADDLAEGLKALTDGRGIDAAFDPVGGGLRRVAFDNLAPLGRLMILGNARGEDESFSSDETWHGTKTVQGLSLGGLAHLVPDRLAAAAREVLDWTAAGELDAEPALVLPLAEAAKAHRLLEERGIAGKIVLRMGA